jgi:filamentous hemagglutinin family protein
VTATLAQQIIANPNGFYFNVHSGLNPGGAVRAQLVKQ